ncbi:S1 family peptidase [Dokdonella koreensis]|uniref:Peptidase S1 domain-containing protein n=1 Tax=Dokdonella koreensis DS-123 TaxID=1300342 RepID=A0A167GSQ0_9GAMM|nr:S1 family peptidase [Dokdonella koreensis]ANB17432.1 Hypothetical protein I596_1404 [Dokdonella koreensis DS-123]
MRPLPLLAVLLALSGPAAGADEAPTIVGGELSARWPGIGALMHGPLFGCTAFLVGPDLVITAAHCIGSDTVAPPDVFFTGPDRDHVLNSYPIATITPHPAYDPATAAFDLAVIRLAEPAVEAVIEVRTTPLTNADIGLPVWMAGYGRDENAQSERKRIGATTIAELIPDNVVVDGLPQGCFGDSGSPLFTAGGGAQPVALGVASFISHENCRGSTYYQRIDRALPFLLGFEGLCVEGSLCSDALFADDFGG